MATRTRTPAPRRRRPDALAAEQLEHARQLRRQIALEQNVSKLVKRLAYAIGASEIALEALSVKLSAHVRERELGREVARETSAPAGAAVGAGFRKVLRYPDQSGTVQAEPE